MSTHLTQRIVIPGGDEFIAQANVPSGVEVERTYQTPIGRVRLRYSEDEARDLDRDSEMARIEAAKRAVRLAAKRGQAKGPIPTPEQVSLVRERVVPAIARKGRR